MSRRFQKDVYINRLDVFRHSFRKLALASAAASGIALAGCADSHTGGGGGDAGVMVDQHTMTRWDPTCVSNETVDITGVLMPAGVDAYRVYAQGLQFGLWWPALGAGEMCTGADTTICESEIQALVSMQTLDGGPFAVARRGTQFMVEPLSAVRPATVASPQAATLYAIDVDYLLDCPNVFGTESYVERTSDGYVVHGVRYDCDVYTGTVHVAPNGDARVLTEMLYQSDVCAVIGRLTAGCDAPPRPASGGELGRYFAQVAGLEAAAVDAFERLARELSELGAPDELVAWAKRGADEEREHTERMGAIARRHGATPTRPTTAGQAFPTRGLFEFAMENAIEGCVRETYGAVVGHHQATHAADPVVREAMRQIAEDETGHAALSWAIADWADAQLSAGERELIAAAQRRAIAALREDVARPEADALIEGAGLPTPAAARAILDGLAAQVWAA